MAKVWNESGVDRTVTIPSTNEVQLVKAGASLDVPDSDVEAFTEQVDIWSERSKAAKKTTEPTESEDSK